jgi:beta-galactosidase
MARAMGLNTVSTYVFWNYHEPAPGEFDFTTERRDLAAFVRTAQEEGLSVIVRPGPYVCAEWEFGGYPWWLLQEENLEVRGQDPRFLEACRRFLLRLGEQLAPLQITRGGPIILVQVENEYGSYGSDRGFMQKTAEMIRAAGFEVPLFTADGPGQCRNGFLPGILPGINGESRFSALRDTVGKFHGGEGPYFIPEYYPGWLDHWGEEHSVVPYTAFLGEYDTLLAAGASVVLYMFHGGTTFGFMNGANSTREKPIQPQPTSYDYDAPLDEAGRPTPKYHALRRVIRRHLPPDTVVPEIPDTNRIITFPPVPLPGSASLADVPCVPRVTDHPLTMEEIGQGYGWIVYRTTLPGPGGGILRIGKLRDFALVFVNGHRVAVLDRRHGQDSVRLDVNRPESRLEIVVENLGRINYGRGMTDNRKGILSDVSYGGSVLKEWEILGVPPEKVPTVTTREHRITTAPSVRRGTVTIDDSADTFFDMRGWGKGAVWVNGHCLGRFWTIGPQQTLYVPGPWLRKGDNEIFVLDLLQDSAAAVTPVSAPILNSLGK